MPVASPKCAKSPGRIQSTGQRKVSHVTDKAAIKKVDDAHKELLQAVREEAFNDLRLKTEITALNNALEIAGEVQQTEEKVIVDELERERLTKVEGYIEED
ncbi:hypothetical protein N7G274_000706 [Stereocaulon virgatum]|uniref:Uncharacterized protein n=1 Tax=Stereocaulon virgatum TaxID=373712 RepID=A0ABR4AQ63_9LECA